MRILIIASAAVTIYVFVTGFFGRQEHQLVLTAHAPREADGGSHFTCQARGVVEPRAFIEEVTVTAICERLGDDGFEPMEPGRPGDLCEKCRGGSDEHEVTCFTLGAGTHELRTMARGKLANADGEPFHRADEVFSNNTLTVTCPES